LNIHIIGSNVNLEAKGLSLNFSFPTAISVGIVLTLLVCGAVLHPAAPAQRQQEQGDKGPTQTSTSRKTAVKGASGKQADALDRRAVRIPGQPYFSSPTRQQKDLFTLPELDNGVLNVSAFNLPFTPAEPVMPKPPETKVFKDPCSGVTQFTAVGMNVTQRNTGRFAVGGRCTVNTSL
jgi:hypothetical protein